MEAQKPLSKAAAERLAKAQRAADREQARAMKVKVLADCAAATAVPPEMGQWGYMRSVIWKRNAIRCARLARRSRTPSLPALQAAMQAVRDVATMPEEKLALLLHEPKKPKLRFRLHG